MFSERSTLILTVTLFFVSTDTTGQTRCRHERPADDLAQPIAGVFGQSLKRYDNQRKTTAARPSNTTETSDNDETIRVRTDLALHQLWVEDGSGNPVSGLERADFIVTEDGERQEIEMFSRDKDPCRPRSIVLVLDTAGFQVLNFNRSIDAARKLVRRLEPSDKMAIVTNDIVLRAPLISDKFRLEQSLESIRAQGVKRGCGWDFEALLASLNELFPVDDSQRIVIFQGDANEIVWLKEDGYFPIKFSKDARSSLRWGTGMRNWGLRDVAGAISRSGAVVYSIVSGIKYLGFSKKEQLARGRIQFDAYAQIHEIGRAPSERKRLTDIFAERYVEIDTAGQAAMVKLSEISGGSYVFLERPGDAEAAYSKIFSLLESRYSIGYYSTGKEIAGKPIRGTIQVKGHPEYKITGRGPLFDSPPAETKNR